MGHGEGPGGSSRLLDLFVFKRYLQKKMTMKTNTVTTAASLVVAKLLSKRKIS